MFWLGIAFITVAVMLLVGLAVARSLDVTREPGVPLDPVAPRAPSPPVAYAPSPPALAPPAPPLLAAPAPDVPSSPPPPLAPPAPRVPSRPPAAPVARAAPDVDATPTPASGLAVSRAAAAAEAPPPDARPPGPAPLSRAQALAQLAAKARATQPAVGIESEDVPTGPVPRIVITATGDTDPGMKRKLNEDSLLLLPDQHVFVVCDGMGGHAAGDVASRLAVDTIEQAFRSGAVTGPVRAGRPRRGDELVRAIEMANAAVLAQARSIAAQTGMGTTAVAARFSPHKQRVYIAHVGDSRCYRLRDGELRQMTRDHTLGALGMKGASAQKLTRAVGIDDEIDVELFVDAPEPNDLYMLCSDGLSKMLPPETIRDVLAAERDIAQACRALIDRSNQRGGRDNITIILVRVDGAVAGRASATG